MEAKENEKEYNDNSIIETRTQVETVQFKCSGCGNNYTYDPISKKLKCPYCGSEEDIDWEKVEEIPYENVGDSFYNEDVEIYRCQNCGAITERTPRSISFECPYCHKTNIVKEEYIKGIKPNGLIPFKLSTKEACGKIKNWVGKKFFVINKIKKSGFESVLKGVYSPCWTFDCDTYSTYKGLIGKHVTERYRDRNGQVHTRTKTEWHHVSGSIAESFDDIKVYSGEEMTNKEFSTTSWFDTNNSVKYEKSYLAGYLAMHYSVPLENAWDQAKSIIRNSIESRIAERYNADEIKDMKISTSHYRLTYKYILLPFYIGSYDYGGKNYRVVVNGATGKIYGKYPISPIKVTIVTILGLVALAGLIYCLMVYGS